MVTSNSYTLYLPDILFYPVSKSIIDNYLIYTMSYTMKYSPS